MRLDIYVITQVTEGVIHNQITTSKENAAELVMNWFDDFCKATPWNKKLSFITASDDPRNLLKQVSNLKHKGHDVEIQSDCDSYMLTCRKF